MRAYSEDLREKIVDAVERRGMNQCETARTFDISLSWHYVDSVALR